MKYQARVLQPAQIEAKLRARSLNAEGLAEFVRVQTGKPDLAWPPSKFEPETLTAIAWFFSSDLEVARAKAETAAAAIITARQRINPSLAGDGGRNKTPDSISTYSFSPAFTIETAGKRGLRILEAEKNAEAARIGVYEAAWAVRTRVRSALSAYLVAQRRLGAAQQEEALRTEVEDIFRKRLELGEGSRPELTQATSEHAVASTALRGAEGEVARALAEVSAAVGLPIELPIEAGSLTTFDSATAQKAGLQHRADIRRSLVAYEAVDTRLRMAIANQYPNITLTPGYQYQEGFAQYTLGTLLEGIPVLNRNQGPIAEQVAARKQAEAEFVALQARVLAEAASATVRYQTALTEWKSAAETRQAVSQAKEAAAATALQKGDGSRLDVTLARLETTSLRRTEDDAFEKLQAALGAVEDAMQTPVWAAIPAPPRLETRAEKTK